MTSSRPISLRAGSAIGVICLVLAGAASAGTGGATTPGAATQGAAAKPLRPADSLSGQIISGEGRWRQDRGRLSIRLIPGAVAARRHLVLRLVGGSCAGQTACVKLQGTLTGTMTALPAHPDIGQRFSVEASRRIAPIGHATAGGLVSGT